jgi:hypothetical protein
VGKLEDVRGGAVSILVNTDQNDLLPAAEIIWWDSHGGTTRDWPTAEMIET